MTGFEIVFTFYMFANLMNLDNMMSERDAKIEQLTQTQINQAGAHSSFYAAQQVNNDVQQGQIDALGKE